MRITNYKIIKNEEELNLLISYCKKTGYASVDFETSGLQYYLDTEYPTILGVSFQPGSAWVIPLGHFDSPFKDRFEDVLQHFGREIIENPNIVKIGWNFKWEYKWFLKYGIRPLGRIFDGMLAKYLLDEERPNGLKDMVRRYLPEFSDYELKGSGSDKFNWAGVPLEELSKYCAADADFTFKLMLQFENKLINAGFYPLYRNLLSMLTRVLGESEHLGFLVNRQYLEGLVDKYADLIKTNEIEIRALPVIKKFEKWLIENRKQEMIDSLQKEIEELEDLGDSPAKINNRKIKIAEITMGNLKSKKDQKIFEPLNFGSPKQMSYLFFDSPEGFGFEPYKISDKGSPSTDEESLTHFMDKDKTGFIKKLLRSRELEKLNSTYITGILPLLDEGDRLHSNYLIHGTVTGRLSSTSPNMQNIPRVTTNPDIRRMFIAPPGKLLVSVDYSQAELRVVAEASGDDTMIEMFKSGFDIHLSVACKVAGTKPEDIIPILKDETHKDHEKWIKLRKRAKRISFGILYGQTAKKLSIGLSEDTGEEVSMKKAQKFLDNWFNTFPRIKEWIDGQHDYAEENGFVYNIFGRKRRLHILNDPRNKNIEFGKWLEALRQSVNAPIQGAASDFTQLTAICIWEEKLRGNLHKDIKQVATIHDENVFEVPIDQVHTFVKRAIEIGTEPDTEKYFHFQMAKVNMKLDAEVGFTFGDMHDYDKNIDYIKFYNDGIQ